MSQQNKASVVIDVEGPEMGHCVGCETDGPVWTKCTTCGGWNRFKVAAEDKKEEDVTKKHGTCPDCGSFGQVGETCSWCQALDDIKQYKEEMYL
jgi:formate dehydrogenase maturation protein FdhE